MTFDEYQTDASRTSAPHWRHADRLANAAIGLCGESGEVAELVKKQLFHGKAHDSARLAEEVGDVLWYVAEVCTVAGLNLADVAQANVAKLRERYPDGFVKRFG
jgi:NTP pyrophosphatase (non-canonical NTP hydrolase)